MNTLVKKYGPWALITGASSGIGQGFAKRLAKDGFKLVLIARREYLLKKLAKQLQDEYQTETRVVVCDLSDDNFMKQLDQSLDSLDIRLLISNAGGGRMGAFSKVNSNELLRMNHLNMSSHMTLGHSIITNLLNCNKRGGILFISSTASLQGVPYGANYSAGKAYLLNLAESLNYELKNKGIDVTALLPGPTSTPGFHENEDLDFNKMPMKPMQIDVVVNEGLNALLKNKPSHIAGRTNRIMGAMGKRFLSRNTNTTMWGNLMKKMTPKQLRV